MRPAFSVIFFTVLSGAGYGLLVVLLGAVAGGIMFPERGVILTSLAVAGALITLGLLCSTLHLGHPERAWRALSQWRSSWLSREGVLALWTYVPLATLFLHVLKSGSPTPWPYALTLLLLFSALATVFATSMIYASLPTVVAWNHPLVPAVYLALSLMSGAMIWLVIVRALSVNYKHVMLAPLCVLLAAGFFIKVFYWRSNRRNSSPASAARATGLGAFGRIQMLQSAHSEDNYLLHEMGFQIARKHASKLRRIAYLATFLVPALLTAFSVIASRGIAIGALVCAVATMLCGLLVERWLFFAEAEHIVMTYYGR